MIPTTYAGSEVTPILGQTENGVKNHYTRAEILPEVVIYDAELTLGLPVSISMTSGLNAMAHAAEALYARDRNPIASLMAVDGLRAMIDALPVIREAPHDIDARETHFMALGFAARCWVRSACRCITSFATRSA